MSTQDSVWVADASCGDLTLSGDEGVSMLEQRPASIRTRSYERLQPQLSHSRSQDHSVVAVDDDDEARHVSTQLSLAVCPDALVSSPQPPGEAQPLIGAHLRRKKSRQSARPTTVDTQSSIELIAWQVQTHASGDTSVSDEIFRPVSVIRSSYTRDTPLFGSFARLAGTEPLMPTTPLRSGLDLVADKVRPASAGAAGSRQSLLDFSFPLPPSGDPSRRVQSAHGRLPPDVIGRQLSDVCPWQHLDSPSIDPLPSWLQLDQFRANGYDALQHQRSSTIDSITLHPRTTSIRHRPHSSDPQHRPPPRSNMTSVGLGPVSEYPMRNSLLRESVSPAEPRNAFTSIVRRHVPRHCAFSARRMALIALTVALALHQLLFLIFEAPFLWTLLSPAPPLAAASLFLMLDTLMFHLHRTEASSHTWLYFGIMLVCSMAYSVALTSAKLVLLTQETDAGADKVGIHFSPGRRDGEIALGQVVKDMPISVVGVGLALLLMVVGVGMMGVVGVRLARRRRRHA